MKNLTDHIRETQLQEPQRRETRTPSRTYNKGPEHLPEQWITRLIGKLQVRFPNQWSSAYPTAALQNAAIEDWAQVLAGLTGEDIGRGLATWSKPFLPNSTEFRDACRVPAAQRDMPQASKVKFDRTVAREELAVMKKYLKMADPAPDRQDPRYIEWANGHRRRIGMRPITDVYPDGSFRLVGDK